MERRDGIKKKLLYAVNAILPLLLGLIVYVCDRPDSYISILVYSLTGFRSSIRFFPTIIDNHFPDFVWAYSLMFVVNSVTGIYKKNLKLSYVISILFAVILELIQLFQHNMFTFDVIDIVVEIVAISLASLVIKVIERK